eukprot:comp22248_c1_seq1/m.32844 comp22248_c1_seq1/g.32844  ORF comp22248_c1_seq1/g.32844 comp22248_c1_seq1/m.32844 type:complete len:1305 (-) comp22248_c1_seq1:384-4298(-)
MAVEAVGSDMDEQDALLLGRGGHTSNTAEEEEEGLEDLAVAFTTLRHRNNGIPVPEEEVARWRIRVRMRTICVGLIVALNIGVDPPDIFKTSPCARKECWLDIHNLPPNKALEQVGQRLQQQYDKLNSRQGQVRYKPCLDPTVDDVKKMCAALRRCAKDERVLVHYNGHGVPRPTDCGEIWLFNKNFTQYIPLSLYEMQSYIAAPSIFVWDCSNAGQIVKSFETFAQQRRQEYEGYQRSGQVGHVPQPPLKDCIHLAACSIDEVLPMNPDLPADLFTACLTTPIEVAFSVMVSSTSKMLLKPRKDLLDQIEGPIADRRTMVGELFWIFTAITDTIAWNVLPRDLFQKLFRQDLLVASLFRNFLLAERIMRSVNCTPVSHPPMPPTHEHPMWQHWDMALDLIMATEGKLQRVHEQCYFPFFADQLRAFEVWLQLGSHERDPPEQLPIVLQVLLSQTHRLRALQLLQEFLDLGSWAVNLALSVGIFPYVLKLLQSAAPEIRSVLCFIWCKILAVDKSCQNDIVKDEGEKYFIEILCNPRTPPREQAMAAFCLSVVVAGNPKGQESCAREPNDLLGKCMARLFPRGNQPGPDPLVRRWLLLCLARLWEDNRQIRQRAMWQGVHVALAPLLDDDVPEVRAACAYVLGTLVGVRDPNGPILPPELDIGLRMCALTLDSSPLVRKEVVLGLHCVVAGYVHEVRAAAEGSDRERDLRTDRPGDGTSSPASRRSSQSISISAEDGNDPFPFVRIWRELLNMAADPFPEVADLAEAVLADHKIPGLKRPLPPVQPVKEKAPPAANPGLIRTFSSKALHWLSDTSDGDASVVVGAPELSPRLSIAAANASPRMGGPRKPAPPEAGPTLLQTLSKDQQRVDAESDETQTTSSNGLSGPGLKSEFFEWSADYLRQPLLKPKAKGVDAVSDQYLLHRYRLRRHRHRQRHGHALEDYTHTAAARAGRNVVTQRATLCFQAEEGQAIGPLSKLVFHPAQPELAVADGIDTVNVWNWKQHEQKSVFRNGNPPGTCITDMAYVNAHDTAMLMLASDDGVLRVWRDYTDTNTRSIVTAWRALSDLLAYRVTREVGMLLDWQQEKGWAVVGGDCSYLRAWDTERDKCAQVLETGGGEVPVTTLGHNPLDPNMIYAGFSDGCVRIYDTRANGKVMMTLSEHRTRIQGGSMQASSRNLLVTGSADSEVRVWDLRSDRSLASVEAHPMAKQCSSIAVHPYAPVFASGTWTHQASIKHHAIRLFHTTDLQPIATVQYHDGFLGQRIASVTSLAFHPFKTVFAAGGADGIVSIYDFQGDGTNTTQNFI